MYVIIDKKSRAILHQSNSHPGEQKKPEELLTGFDAKTMVFGKSAEQFIPVHFEIKDGVVVNQDPVLKANAPPAETITRLRERKKKEITNRALFARSQLLPDYKLLNAGLGLYDDARVAAIRATVDAFRDEVNRVEAQIAKAKSAKELEAVHALFPTELVTPKVSKGKSK